MFSLGKTPFSPLASILLWADSLIDYIFIGNHILLP